MEFLYYLFYILLKNIFDATPLYPEGAVKGVYGKTKYIILLHKEAKLYTKLDTGQRNPRGQLLADFMTRESLFMMNSFFRKPASRKRT